jgi:hypothetical protein
VPPRLGFIRPGQSRPWILIDGSLRVSGDQNPVAAVLLQNPKSFLPPFFSLSPESDSGGSSQRWPCPWQRGWSPETLRRLPLPPISFSPSPSFLPHATAEQQQPWRLEEVTASPQAPSSAHTFARRQSAPPSSGLAVVP